MARPCRQLNSKVIRGVAECSILPIVDKKCSVIAVKCIWRVADEEIDQAWRWICEKRDLCGKTLRKLEEVAFFFSSISTCESGPNKGNKRKGGKKSKPDAEDSDTEDGEPGESGTLMSQGSTVVTSVIDKKIFPAISYWIACQTRNGALASPVSIKSALLKCGLEVTSTRTTRKSGSDALNKLCQVLKDHKNQFMEQLVTSSYLHCLRPLRDSTLGIEDNSSPAECSQSENVVRLEIVREYPFKQKLSLAVRDLRRAGLNVDCFEIDELSQTIPSASSDISSKPLSCPATVLCNDIALMMAKLGYATNRGDVYKKCELSRFTYKYLCTMKAFLHSLMGNETFKDRLVQNMSRVLPLLSDPDNRIIMPLKIDRDLIEVSNGWCWCWSFKTRSFMEDAIPAHEIGHTSPRAFVAYNHEGEPEPKYFSDILTNSLDDDELAQFCEDFLALFVPKEHKRPVPCLIGAPNSGKTSLFAPLFQIIPLNRIARVTKQKSFNKAMIDENTEVIFLDEAYVSMMDPDDWKLLCQGGYTSHDAKWKNARPFMNRASMFVTAQVDLEFATEDQDAMEKRLHKYHFKALPNVVPTANQWLRHHAMDCIVWAARKTAGPEQLNTSPQPHDLEEDGGTGLTEEELERIRTTTLEPEAESDSEAGSEADSATRSDSDTDELLSCSEHEEEEKTTGSAADEQQRLKLMLGKTVPGSLRHRHLKQLLIEAGERRQSLQRLIRKSHEAQKDALLTEGLLDSQEVDELKKAAKVPAHLDRVAVERRLEKAQKEREEEHRRVKKQIEDGFKNAWLQAKEKELWQHQREMERARTDSAVWQNYRSLMEINANKIRTFHDNSCSTSQLQHAIECRRKMLLDLNLITPEQAPLICRLDDVLPSNEQEDDDSGILATPPYEPEIAKPLEDYSDPAAWGAVPVHKRKPQPAEH